MATYTWSNAQSGTWSTAGNWTPSGVPGSGDLALIDLAGSYVVTLDVSEIGSLTLDAAGARLTPSGTLRLDGTLDVRAGTLTVSHAIQGGTIAVDGGTIAYDGGTLDGVTLSGPLDLSAAGSSLTIADGIGFTGTAPGQILDTGAGSTLDFSGAGTLDDVAVTVGSGASLAAGVLTLDPSGSLSADGSRLTLGYPYSSGDALDNKGMVSLTSTTLSINGMLRNDGVLLLDSDGTNPLGIPNLINSGTVEFSGAAAGGSKMAVQVLTNTGDITLSHGAHVTVNSYSMTDTLSNTGTITIDPTSTLELFYENYTLARIEDIASHVDNQGGTVLIDGILDLQGATVDIGADNPAAAGYELNSATIQNGTIKTDGTGIHYAGYYNTLSNVTIDGPLDVNGGANTELIIDANSSFAAGSPIRITETTPGSYLEFDGSRTLDHATLTLGNSSFYVVQPPGSYGGGTPTLTLGPDSLMTLTGSEYFGSPNNVYESSNSILDNKGTIIATAGGLGGDLGSGFTGATLENEGVLTETNRSGIGFFQISNFGPLSLSGGSSSYATTFDNTGTVIIADGSNLTLTAPTELYEPVGMFESSGVVRISTGSTLKLGNGGSLGTVSFGDGTGTLVLSQLNPGYSHFNPASTVGTLDMFQAGDVLDLGPIPSVQTVSLGSYSISHSGNTLTVDLDGNPLDRLALTGGDYTDATFTLTGDIVSTDATPTSIAANEPPCFCAGTLILTDRGERAVETLEIGDLVVTLQDGIETLMPVRWLGRRRMVVAPGHDTEHVDPVRISRDAIAPGVPMRDLHVSPDHALYLDSMLIQARQLVNGMTIIRDTGRAVVTYHHVELDRHAVLIADGMPCESYLDTGNRGQFDSAGTVVPLHGPAANRARTACAPFVTEPEIVRPIWQRLADRAIVAGHTAPEPRIEADLPPWLETMAGARLPRLDGNRHALSPGCRQVRLRSRADRPTTLAPWSDDRRRLGVAVSAIRLHRGDRQQELTLSELAKDGGWWPLESAGTVAWRWTDGDGRIVLPEPADAIEIVVHAILPVVAAEAVDGIPPVLAWAG